jgi:hypothetical protein
METPAPRSPAPGSHYSVFVTLFATLLARYWAATTIASPSAVRLTPMPQALASRPV